MSSPTPPFPRHVTLEELIAFNEELLALARGGAPLERGLMEGAREMPRRIGALAAAVGSRLDEGQTLEQVFEQCGHAFPPIYRAVVAIGARTGRFPAAIEALTSSLRRVAELHRIMLLSLVYPVIILLLAYVVFVASVVILLPRMVNLYDDSRLMVEQLRGPLETLIINVWSWAPFPPLAGLAVLGFIIRQCARYRPRSWLTLPGIGRATHLSRVGAMLEVTSLLVHVGMPLDQALPLAADAVGDRDLRRDAAALADAVRQGAVSLPIASRRGLPPFVRAILMTERNQLRLAGLLRREADATLRRARHFSQVLSGRLPLVTAVAIGGTTILTMALWLLGPWYWFLYQLSQILPT